MKIKLLRNAKISLSFTVVGYHALVAFFHVTNMSLNSVHENEILAIVFVI